MKLIKENKIELDWLLGVIGIKNNWLSKEEFLSNIKNFDKHEDLYIELYLEEDLRSDDMVKAIMEKLKFSSSQLQLGELVWQLLFLKKVKNSNISVHQKLNEIAALWSTFNYIQSWKKFINYMPIEKESQITGEENLYDNFIEFYNENIVRVKKYGYDIEEYD